MANKTIIFFKTLASSFKSTEQYALEVLSDSKYDKFPQYIDKSKIEEAFDEYGHKLNPFNSEIYTNSISNSPNIEGHFLSQNLPSQVDSIVVDETCSKDVLYKYLDNYNEISHIGLSVYAMGMDESLNIIKIISKDFADKELYLGGIGVLFPHIQNLAEMGIIKRENICFGSGINWLRNKLGFRNLKPNQIKIPKIKSPIYGFPKKVNSEYLITQIGCPYECDFCITAKFLHYNPFSTNPQKIINRLEEMRQEYEKDIFLFLCDPNAFFPLRTWKEVFHHFSNKKVRKGCDNYIFLLCLASMTHLRDLGIEKIQKDSCVKIFMINYGMESTLDGGYIKNRGISNEFIKAIKSLGIIPHQNFIIGLPRHTEKNLDLEIKNNLEYDAVWFSVNTLKPLPTTMIYNQIKDEDLLFGNDLPPELLYRDGFFPFKHKNLGGGFSALKYAFKSYIECEKKVIDVYLNFSETICNNPGYETSTDLQSFAKFFFEMSKKNFDIFKLRMEEKFIKLYQKQLQNKKLY
ncbi:MAG: hypothetical protein ACFFEY_11670 [Candidatus Thorarchaeota archaeon]